MGDDEDKTAADSPRSREARERRAELGAADRYELLETLGKGGMGEVVAARDDVIGRDVAIKRMLTAAPTPDDIDRFLREARIQGGLDHPAIPPVYELARDADQRPYFVMKRLAGTTLAAIVKGLASGDAELAARYPRQRLLRAFADVCLAVERAHSRGVVHRDVKPSNIMLGEFGEVYVLDWGVAKVLDEGDELLRSLHHAVRGDSSTEVGTAIGTPAYMAPEQSTGDVVDARADVYALGCVLFELLTLRQLHGKERAADRSPAHRAPDRDVPPELDALCLEATTFDPAARLASARQLGERVQRYLDGDRDLERRRELARAHLARATEAVTGGDDERAMREAGSALALDPTLGEAAQLVTRLMLEPPRDTPAEVVAQIAGEEEMLARRHAQKASRAYFMYFAFLPSLAWSGIDVLRYLLPIAALIAFTCISVWLGRWFPTSRPRAWLSLAGNIGLIGFIAHLLTPFLIAPGIATTTAIVSLRNPLFRRFRLIGWTIVGLALAVLVPLLGELLGWWRSTTTV
ncbi:MAG: serine/threonine-protein kinase, partial [Acidobacteriota bacterium]